MKQPIQFTVTKGEKKYVAEATDFPIVTQADTLDELAHNIQEATELYFEDGETTTKQSRKTPFSINLLIPHLNHA